MVLQVGDRLPYNIGIFSENCSKKILCKNIINGKRNRTGTKQSNNYKPVHLPPSELKHNSVDKKNMSVLHLGLLYSYRILSQATTS
jgi:hypothetical protein